MCPSIKHFWRVEREGREGVFHGSFVQKIRCDAYSSVGVASRAVWLDRAYDGHAICALSHIRAEQPCAG